MLRRSPRAALLWCLALLVTVVTTTWVGGTLASIRRQDLRYGRVVEFAVARHDLPVGTVVRGRDLGTARARGGARPPGALAPRWATGRVLVVAVLRGQAVTTRHLRGATGGAGDGVVVPGWRAMRVTVADAPRLRAGDHVDVYVTFDPAQVPESGDPTLVVAEAVPVVAVDAGGATVGSAGAGGSGSGGSGSGAGSGVTLLVDVDEAPRLAYASANGVLALALVAPEEARDPTPAGGTRTLPSR